MKKLLAMILAAMMLLSLVACGGNNDTESDVNNDTETKIETDGETVADTDADTEGETEADTEADAPAGKDIIPTVDAETMGGKVWNIFYTAATANPSATAEELANSIAGAGVVPYMLGGMALNNMVAPDEEGKLYLQGFDNYDFTGLDTEKSAIFMPMIGSIPFIGYIFELSEGQDAASFIKTLQDNANLRWYICVTADQMVAGSAGNKVFFLMCPETTEEDPGMAL